MKAGLSDLPSKALIFCHTGEKDGWLLIRWKIEVFFKKKKKIIELTKLRPCVMFAEILKDTKHTYKWNNRPFLSWILETGQR